MGLDLPAILTFSFIEDAFGTPHIRDLSKDGLSAHYFIPFLRNTEVHFDMINGWIFRSSLFLSSAAFYSIGDLDPGQYKVAKKIASTHQVRLDYQEVENELNGYYFSFRNMQSKEQIFEVAERLAIAQTEFNQFRIQ